MEASPTVSPRLAVLDLLWRRGFPTVLAGAGEVVPATIVWVDRPDDAALRLLPRAFGGHLLLDMRDHHGEPTPAFWLGVGRSAVLAAAALARWRDLVGTPPAHATLLGNAAAAAWDTLNAIADTRLRPARAENVREAADALRADVARALPIAPHIADGLVLALGTTLRAADASGASSPGLPTRRERDAWVAAFAAPLAAP